MNKTDLIHTTILIVGILCGYSALQSALYFLTSLTYSVDLYHLQGIASPLENLIPVALYSIACAILIRNGRKYATTLLNKDEDSFAEEAVEWQLDRRNIIFILFIGMGLYTLILAVPFVISDFFDLFKDKVGASALITPAKKNYLVTELLRTTIGIFLIYAAPSFTNYIDKTIAVRLDSGSQSS
jgi:hypothetical protein